MAVHERIIPDELVAKVQKAFPHSIGVISNGKRMISIDILTYPSPQPMSVASSASSSSASLDVPIYLESVQTVEWLGFSPSCARYLFGKWEEYAKKMGDKDLLSFCQEWIRGRCDMVHDTEDDWEKTLNSIEIWGRMRNALLDPKHLSIRSVQPLSEWLCEMIECNFDALVDMPDILLRTLDPKAAQTPYLRGGGFESDYTVPSTPGEHIILFKSVSLKYCRKVLKENGEVNLFPLSSFGPTDFAQRGGLYFTHELWVASHYSSLIEDACAVCDRRTVEISVPLQHLKDEKMLELKFDDQWRSLIFYSRRDGGYPKEISRLRASHNVIHGPIAHNANQSFGKMKSPSDITEKHLLWETVGKHGQKTSNTGKHYVWISDDAITRLNEVVKGKVWVRKPEKGYELVKAP